MRRQRGSLSLRAAGPPARATVESKLAAPGLDVEIMVEAAIDRPNARGAGAAKKAGARKAGAKAGPRRAAKKAAKKAARKAAKK